MFEILRSKRLSSSCSFVFHSSVLSQMLHVIPGFFNLSFQTGSYFSSLLGDPRRRRPSRIPSSAGTRPDQSLAPAIPGTKDRARFASSKPRYARASPVRRTALIYDACLDEVCPPVLSCQRRPAAGGRDGGRIVWILWCWWPGQKTSPAATGCRAAGGGRQACASVAAFSSERCPNCEEPGLVVCSIQLTVLSLSLNWSQSATANERGRCTPRPGVSRFLSCFVASREKKICNSAAFVFTLPWVSFHAAHLVETRPRWLLTILPPH